MQIGAPISRWGFKTSDSALKCTRRVPGGSIPSPSPDGEAGKVGWWWSNVYREIESVCALSHVPVPQKVFEHAEAHECFLDLLVLVLLGSINPSLVRPISRPCSPESVQARRGA